MYRTFGAPSGAFGASNGAQSGTESRMSTLITPLNRSLITPTSHVCRWKKIAHRSTRFHHHKPPTAEHHPDQVIIPADGSERRRDDRRWVYADNGREASIGVAT